MVGGAAAQVLDIAAGVLQRPTGEVLVARRRPGTHGAGKWEFPGGKLEPGEDNRQALERELKEELGVDVLEARPLLAFSHQYSERRVRLQMWLVTKWQGLPEGCEGQPLQWARPDTLSQFDLLDANEPIVNALRLPGRYLITPSLDGEIKSFMARLMASVEHGVGMVRLRQPGMADDQYVRLAVQCVAALASTGVPLLLDRPLNLPGAAGVQLSMAAAAEHDREGVSGWFGVSCHNREELQTARAMGADFATMSPLRATQTHPEARPLGWEAFADACRDIALPVYALGGLSAADMSDAWCAGAQGVAAIRGLWQQSG